MTKDLSDIRKASQMDRRAFLATLIGAGAAMGIPALVEAQEGNTFAVTGSVSVDLSQRPDFSYFIEFMGHGETFRVGRVVRNDGTVIPHVENVDVTHWRVVAGDR